ncbi:MAG TPA: hypothetical protein VGN57_04345 [Pirellulaceae bacterium]|nr:hypothetical protein [Pirellulaceae bacterium]
MPTNVMSVEDCAHHDDDMTVIGDVQLKDSVRAYAWTKSDGLEVVGTMGTESHGMAVSEDGSVVVGTYMTEGGEERAFVWTEAEGTLDMGDFGGSYVVANDVSANGNIIVGAAENEMGHLRAFRVTVDQAMEGELPGLGTLGGNQSEALFVSADGQTVVGRSQVRNGDWHLFRWTAGDEMRSLGSLGGTQVQIRDMSDDAKVVVGTAQNSDDLFVPFVWTQTTGLVRIPGVGDAGGAVEFVSDDGSYLYGQASIGGSVRKAYQLSLSNFSLLQLGSLFKQRATLVSSASADGDVIGGQAINQKGQLEAFLRVEESMSSGFLKQGRLHSMHEVMTSVFGSQMAQAHFFVDVPCMSHDGHSMIVEARKSGNMTTFMHVEIDDYPEMDDDDDEQGGSYFESRPLRAEIEQYMSMAFDNATLMAEAYPSTEVASYVALYADYAQQYQAAAANLMLNGRNDAKVRGRYASYRYYSMQMTYYAYAYTYYYMYLPSFGTADYSEETLEAMYQSYYYQNLDLEDMMDD